MLLILGNQLFGPRHLPPPATTEVFMAEDLGLCTEVQHHQQKLVLFLAAMRAYADELRTAGYTLHYLHLDPSDSRPYEHKLAEVLDARGDSRLVHFEIEDKSFEDRIVDFARTRGMERDERPSPMFTCSRAEFGDYARGKSRLLMADFYKQQRRRLGILVDERGEPVGGRWSFDADNRKKLPRKLEPPTIRPAPGSEHVQEVVALVERHFASHPGCAAEFWWPTTRAQAEAWLDDFIDQRLAQFGPYEDAMSTRSATVFHSLLSPLMNLGLLTPATILDRVLAKAEGVPIQSLEGFVRQVIGWREFVRGVYREFGERQHTTNFWAHERGLGPAWTTGETGIPPLDDTIQTAQRLGWTHHIPRLMVLGNLMTLCEIHPHAAHRWFMEMYVDSSDWVMGPNVYGMGLFSDGGVFATKPYICGSNYLRKMSDYPKGPWTDIVDGLYWRFVAKHREFFARNHRLAMMARALDRLAPARRETIFAAAEGFLAAHTLNPTSLNRAS